jgi:hypothetical protein
MGAMATSTQRDEDREQREQARATTSSRRVCARAHTLAYAQTAHAAEGRTADTAHVLVDPSMDRAALYVGLSRGMQSNVAYVAVEGDQHRLDRLSAMPERDDVERTAVQVQADEFAAAEHLGRLGPQWTDLVAIDASERYRTVLHDALGEERGRRVDADTASGPLYRLVRSAELDGHNAEELLTRAVHARELDSADSIAQVLHHRIERRVGAGGRGAGTTGARGVHAAQLHRPDAGS